MEKELLVKDSNSKGIKNLSNALKNGGIKLGFDVYYMDENCDFPFFKIPKKYKKESENDPPVHYVFIDVDESDMGVEYTVSGSFSHEHSCDLDCVIKLVKGLLTGDIVEVALVYKFAKATFFLPNTGDPQTNVNFLSQDKELINKVMDTLNNPMLVSRTHLHVPSAKLFPYNLLCKAGPQQQIEGVEIYLVSSVLAEHPEYYIIK